MTKYVYNCNKISFLEYYISKEKILNVGANKKGLGPIYHGIQRYHLKTCENKEG